MTHTVIVGCGYVGRELGRQLLAIGHDVSGVRRSESGLRTVREAGIDPIEADVTDTESLGALPPAENVVYMASAGGRSVAAARDVYVDGLRGVIDEYGRRSDRPDRLVYTSSTGVYGDHAGKWVTEETPIEPATDREAVLAAAERIAREESSAVGIDGTVVRFAGLYGPDRYRLDRYLEGPVTAGWLNLLHRTDAAGSVRYLLETGELRDDVLLVVDDEPVDKHEFADWLADQCGVERPPKQSLTDRLADPSLSAASRERLRAQKRCSNERLHSIGYDLSYPTYQEGYSPAIERHRHNLADDI